MNERSKVQTNLIDVLENYYGPMPSHSKDNYAFKLKQWIEAFKTQNAKNLNSAAIGWIQTSKYGKWPEIAHIRDLLPKQEYGKKVASPSLSPEEEEAHIQITLWYNNFMRGIGLGSHPNHMRINKQYALKKLLIDYSGCNKKIQKQPFSVKLRNAWQDGWIENKIEGYLFHH